VPSNGRSDAELTKSASGPVIRPHVDGQIESIWLRGQFMWVSASTAPRFIPARDAILAALKKEPKTVPALARATGKGTNI